MAEYDIDNLPSSFKKGDIINCPYKGTSATAGVIKSITLPQGRFKLEAWGAKGYQYSTTYTGGIGGYSVGVIDVASTLELFLVCGGIGSKSGTSLGSGGGYNGGGHGFTSGSYSGGGGGGATHIAKRTGILSTLSSYLSDILLVAGGGGGSGYRSSSYAGKGGNGGGTTGGNGTSTQSSTSNYGTGGTQTAGGSAVNSSSHAKGSFGQGGSQQTSSPTRYAGGGGGGLYGGGGGFAYGAGGGGGSGFISSELTEASTSGETTSTNPDTTNYAGYIRITVVSVPTPPRPSGGIHGLVNIDSSIYPVKNFLAKVDNAWRNVVKGYTKIENIWRLLGSVSPSDVDTLQGWTWVPNEVITDFINYSYQGDGTLGEMTVVGEFFDGASRVYGNCLEISPSDGIILSEAYGGGTCELVRYTIGQGWDYGHTPVFNFAYWANFNDFAKDKTLINWMQANGRFMRTPLPRQVVYWQADTSHAPKFYRTSNPTNLDIRGITSGTYTIASVQSDFFSLRANTSSTWVDVARDGEWVDNAVDGLGGAFIFTDAFYYISNSVSHFYEFLCLNGNFIPIPTNFAGCSWKVYDNPICGANVAGSWDTAIAFTSNGETFVGLDFGDHILWYLTSYDPWQEIEVYRKPSWVDEAYKDVLFTGNGVPDYVGLIMRNGVVTEPEITSLVGYKWQVFNTYNLAVSFNQVFYDFEGTYTGNSGTNKPFTQIDFNPNDGSITAFDGSSSYSIYRNNSVQGNITLSITGGADAENPELIKWFKTNGILTKTVSPAPLDGYILNSDGTKYEGASDDWSFNSKRVWILSTTTAGATVCEDVVFSENTTTLTFDLANVGTRVTLYVGIDNIQIGSFVCNTVAADRSVAIPAEYLDGSRHKISIRASSATQLSLKALHFDV